MPHEGISITIDPNDPESIRRALNTEWLLTNGLGGYAMGTVLGVNTRRYHGLLVAAPKPPLGRIVALHSMIEQLIIPNDDAPGGEEVIDLSTQQFVGPPPDGEPMLHPGGWRCLSMMCRVGTGTQSISWSIPGYRISRMLHQFGMHQIIVAQYVIEEARKPCRLRLRPFTPLRDFHSLNPAGEYSVVGGDGRIQVTHGSLSLELKGEFTWNDDPQWWSRFFYHQDQTRGQDCVENVWSPGTIEFTAGAAQHFSGLQAWVIDHTAPRRPHPKLNRSESDDDSSSVGTVPETLLYAAQQFVVSRRLDDTWSTSVIAGYPWFGDWGRDTMISLPGLMLCTGRFDEARSCLEMFARHLKNGLIPNLFDDYGGAAHYNTVDASLWFVHAVYEYWRTNKTSRDRQGADGRTAALRHSPLPDGRGSFAELIAACRTIIAAYRNGTDFNIRMDDDGLISAGDETTQLTWMDAKRDGVVFTPRHGKAVEINALWYNALCCAAEMMDDESEREELQARSRQTAESFRAKFWWQEKQCLHDVLLPSSAVPGPDGRSREAASGNSHNSIPSGQLRPNQIFAVSLPFSPLTSDQQWAVVKIVGERLLTPFGLRTLDRDDPNYRGRYEGTMFERDRAYHNGTVWPWLIGPYCEAFLRVNEFRTSAKRQAAGIIQPLIDEMSNTSGGRCLGQIAEIYDGDPPHLPNGCPAQAWSVAEVLRVQTMIE